MDLKQGIQDLENCQSACVEAEEECDEANDKIEVRTCMQIVCTYLGSFDHGSYFFCIVANVVTYIMYMFGLT